nr:MAG TPA: hypothetical protein [Caudoviricetes sp.]
MCFVAYKGLFYRVLSHCIVFILLLTISVQYVNLFHSIQKPIDPFYRFVFCSRVFLFCNYKNFKIRILSFCISKKRRSLLSSPDF